MHLFRNQTYRLSSGQEYDCNIILKFDNHVEISYNECINNVSNRSWHKPSGTSPTIHLEIYKFTPGAL